MPHMDRQRMQVGQVCKAVACADRALTHSSTCLLHGALHGVPVADVGGIICR
jgi:hypothetical protein